MLVASGSHVEVAVAVNLFYKDGWNVEGGSDSDDDDKDDDGDDSHVEVAVAVNLYEDFWGTLNW